jgi:hypothetical protein
LNLAIIRAPLMNPRAAAERTGLLRDWSEVATAVLHVLNSGKMPSRFVTLMGSAGTKKW